MAVLTPAQVYQYLTQAGATPLEAAALTSIAQRESGFNPQAHALDSDDDSYGLFQINMRAHRQWMRDAGMPIDGALLDPANNARAAVAVMRRSGGLSPWRTDSGTWNDRVDLSVGARASGGAVSVDQLAQYGGTSARPSGNSGTTTSGTGSNMTQTSEATQFRLPAGGQVFKVGEDLLWVANVRGSKIYYKIGPDIRDRISNMPDHYAGTMSLADFRAQPNLVNGGSAVELSGRDIQGAHSYQEWMNRQLTIFSGNDQTMLADHGVVNLLLEQAANQISDQEFAARVKNTNWWKASTSRQRNFRRLSPAEREAEIRNARAQLEGAWWSEVGTQIPANNAELDRWAVRIANGTSSMMQATWNWIRPQAEKNGESPWSRTVRAEREAQRERAVDIANEAGRIEDLYQEWGIKGSTDAYKDWARKVVEKRSAEEDLVNMLKRQAQTLYAWKDPNLSTREAAQPWVDTYKRVMEQNVDLFNPKVQAALTKGQPIYDFEKQLKAAPEWLKTKNGHETMLSAADEVAKRMGFIK